jgi:hypothetical protein
MPCAVALSVVTGQHVPTNHATDRGNQLAFPEPTKLDPCIIVASQLTHSPPNRPYLDIPFTMSMPNEALQKVRKHPSQWTDRRNWHGQILQEISQKKAFAEQQLLIVRQQKAARTREGRMLQLTASEVETLPKETKVYEGVGKM